MCNFELRLFGGGIVLEDKVPEEHIGEIEIRRKRAGRLDEDGTGGGCLRCDKDVREAEWFRHAQRSHKREQQSNFSEHE